MARTHNLNLPRIICKPVYYEHQPAVYKAMIVLPIYRDGMFPPDAEIFSKRLHTNWGFSWMVGKETMRAEYVPNPSEEGDQTTFPKKAEAIRIAVQAIRAAGYKGDIIGVGVYRETEKTEPTIYVAAKHISRSGVLNPKFTWKIFIPVEIAVAGPQIAHSIAEQFDKKSVKVFTNNPFWIMGKISYCVGTSAYDYTCRIIRGEGLSFSSAKKARNAGERLLRDNGYTGAIKKIILK